MCNLCKFSLEKNEFFNAYINFTTENFKLYISLENKIYDDCTCPNCCINLLKEKNRKKMN